jgi:hypothetical protein
VASVMNRSPYRVSVKNRPELTREFPLFAAAREEDRTQTTTNLDRQKPNRHQERWSCSG